MILVHHLTQGFSMDRRALLHHGRRKIRHDRGDMRIIRLRQAGWSEQQHGNSAYQLPQYLHGKCLIAETARIIPRNWLRKNPGDVQNQEDCIATKDQDGHAFGLRPTTNPITRWPALAETWMRTIGVLPSHGDK
jgi:hypothetical protein